MKTVEERLDDLEHDNNVLRGQVADILVDNSILRRQIDKDVEIISVKVTKLVKTVNEFVSRFAVVN